MKEIIYLVHPVSAEEKAKHKGKKIVDARFKPDEVEPEKPKSKRKTKE